MSFLVSALIAQSCQIYSIRCDCFPNVPFEGFKIHVVETCGQKETWSTNYYAPAYDTAEECSAAIKTDLVCQDLVQDAGE